ncbi:MAG TPA: cytochrome c biogenesis protein DipZ [Xanthobacteraceae bacterium]|jgi:cytochrome c biogenesis protein CcdA
MTLLVLAYLGGVLTIVSPCILPVLPFVFARADHPFIKSGLPMLVGMAATFAAIATLAVVAGGWAVDVNQYGRAIALVVLAALGLTLIFPSLADHAMRPLVNFGAKLSSSLGAQDDAILPSFLLGVATGFLWAPCAGPILGLILTGAALNGANVTTSLLLLAYAAGAATSLALALAVGGRVFAAMKRSLGAGEWIRRGLGVAVLISVAAIALGLDTGFLTRVSLSNTASLEQGLVDRLGPTLKSVAKEKPRTSDALSGAVDWLNSPPLTIEGLKGKVIVIDFWTYSCINCLRSIPYVEAWAEKYKDHGLVVIGVHTPEFAFERNINNVRAAVSNLKIEYPVAIDNEYKIWRSFDNRYWPAHYFIDAKGRTRFHHFGEGDYDQSEQVIQQLLEEAGNGNVPHSLVNVNASGVEAAASVNDDQSPETYIGYDRADNFASPGGIVENERHVYVSASPQLNQWSLSGDWTVRSEVAVLNGVGGSIVYRFHARDLHLVLGPAADGKPIRFRVTINGNAPGADHGIDTDMDGQGVVDSQRLYQLVRQNGAIRDRTFAIEFLDPGVHAYAFTFG